MYAKHPKLDYWVSEDGFLIKQKGLGERKSFATKTGYLSISHQGKSYLIHRLVYEAFYGEIPHGYQINHINGIKSDNRLRNLEIVTAKENMRHAVVTGLKVGSQAQDNGMAKLDNDSYYKIICDIMNGKSNEEIANEYGLHSRYVSLIRGKKRLEAIWEQYEAKHGKSVIPKSGDNSRLTLLDRINLLSELPYSTNKQIARDYGLDPSCVSRIRSKKTWRNIWDVFEGKVQRSA